MSAFKHTRLLLVILFTASSFLTFAQEDWYNSNTYWMRLQLDTTLLVNANNIDTAIVVASNRIMYKYDMRFLSQEHMKNNKVHYFFVYQSNGKWHVMKTPTLYAAMQYMPNKNRDWVVYTEGMGKIFTSDVERGMNMTTQHNVNVLLLDYPSSNPKKGAYGNYRFALKNAKIAHKYFLPVLDTVRQLHDQHLMGEGHLSLFFHSMGNNVLREIGTHKQMGTLNQSVWADNIILNAPCVPQKNHKKWLDNVHFANNIYVNYNPHDKTLRIAHNASFTKQLGEKVCKPISTNANYINFYRVADEKHSNFITLPNHATVVPAAIQYYETVLHGKAVALDNTAKYVPSMYRKLGWDLLPTP